MLSSPPRLPCRTFTLLAAVGLAAAAAAHPIPDVPVNSSFEADGACLIRVEVDPRCFEADPNTSPSLLYGDFQKKLSEDQRTVLKGKAKEFLKNTVEFILEPQGRILPEFEFEFTKQEGEPLKIADEIVVLTGTWRTTVPEGTKGYRIRALKEGKLCVLFRNNLRGKAVERISVLFPGETSYLLDPAGPVPPPSSDAVVESPDAGGEPRSSVRLVVVAGSAAVAALGLWWLARRPGRLN